MTGLLDRLRVALAGRYIVERELGRGGMAVVYLAADLRHDRKVAIKVMSGEVADLGAERFLREIQIAARLTHPHILPLHDSGAVAGVLWYVTPFIEGESLEARLRRERPLPLEEALEIAAAVALALDYAHRRHVVHRDIKPANILLHDGSALVADFGIARAFAVRGEAVSGGGGLTIAGLALGTPNYMSPEQAMGEQELDGRSDIYSLGCVLFEMLAGRPPFTGDNARVIMSRHVLDDPPRLRDVAPGVPDAVDRAVATALAKAPGDRFATAADFARALRVPNEALAGRAAPPPTAPTPISVAVLPFANLSADQENDYFSDGMTEELIDALAKVPGLRVAARTSVLALKGAHADAREIGAKLNVGAFLTGSVRKARDQLRITAQLVNVADGYQVWSERFDRSLHDVFAVQEEIAQTIVQKLRPRLALASGLPLVTQHTDNVEAYQLYLRGRFYWNNRYELGLQRGLEFFQRAIELDPQYGLAYTGVADSYSVLGVYAYIPSLTAHAKARAAAERALALTPAVAEAHFSLGLVKFWFEYDFEGAEREFRRALALKPSYAEAISWLGQLLASVGRFDEGIAAVRAAAKLEPHSPLLRTFVSLPLLLARRFDEVIEETRQVLETVPDFLMALWIASIAYAALGRYDEAIAHGEKALEMSRRGIFFLSSVAWAYGLSGRPDVARHLSAEMLERRTTEYVAPLHLASPYLAVGEMETALEYLERAYEERNGTLSYIGTLMAYDPLRGEPRFQALLAKLGLSQPLVTGGRDR